MTDTLNRAAYLAVVVVLIAAVAIGASALAAGASATETTGADLIIDQPSHVESDVDRQNDGGTPVYVVEGHEFTLHLQNADLDNVVDYGVATGVGELSHDSRLDRWHLETNGETGSFEVYWVEEREREQRTENATTTVVDRTRYEAVVRVDDLSTVVVMSPSEADRLEDDAEKWQDWNATVTDVRTSGIIGHSSFLSPESNEQVMQSMVNSYLTLRSPTHLLDGGFTGVVLLVTTTLGGLFAFLLLKIPDAYALREIYGELFERKRLDEQEGELAQRQEQTDLEERLTRFANVDWNDIPPYTDREARGMREDAAAETPLEGLHRLMWTFHPARLKESRVRAMGKSGFVARVERADGATDGGDIDVEVVENAGEPGPIIEAELVSRDEALDPDESVEDREDIVEIDEPSERLLDAIAVDDSELVDFPMDDPDRAPFDLEAFEDPPADLSVSKLREEFDLDDLTFDDDERVGELVLQFVEMVANHPLTDEEGHVDPVRLELESLFQFLQAADDRYQVPLAKFYRQHFDRAIQEYDRNAEFNDFLDDHRSKTDA